MVSTVMRIDERKDRDEAHLAVGEGSLQELGVSVQSIRRAYWRGDIPAYRISAMLGFDLERVQRIFLAKGCHRSYDHAARDRRREPATRTAASPPFGNTGATRGHYPQGLLQEVQGFHEFTVHPHD